MIQFVKVWLSDGEQIWSRFTWNPTGGLGGSGRRRVTGAMRNLVYDNADNKLALVEENGIFELLRALREQDDELRKNVTGGLVPARYPPPTPSRTSRRLFPRTPRPCLGTSL